MPQLLDGRNRIRLICVSAANGKRPEMYYSDQLCDIGLINLSPFWNWASPFVELVRGPLVALMGQIRS